MNLVPDSVLLSRMNEILTRDFPGYVCGISVGTGFNDVEITYSRTYCIYGVETYEQIKARKYHNRDRNCIYRNALFYNERINGSESYKDRCDDAKSGK